MGPQEKVVVQKRVVIVEKVEYSPGSSVMINSPVKQASMEKDANADDDPTVIWLFDSGDDAKKSDHGTDKPAKGSSASDASPDAGNGTDAGAKLVPRGQPI